MVRSPLMVLAAAFLAAPALAAPSVTAKVTHNCCGQCDRALVATGSKVAWISEVKSDRPNLSLAFTTKGGTKVDLAALMNAYREAGFPLQQVKLEGVKVVEINAGHLCCGGCVNPLKTALSTVTSIATVEARPNQPVRIQFKEGPVDVSGLMKTLTDAGYSANTLVVIE